MSYKKAFPDFDYIPLFIFRDEYTDTSYKNDICPSFEYTTTDKYNVRIWCDYKNTDKREYVTGSLYSVQLRNIDGDFIKDLFLTDCENDLRIFLIQISNLSGAELIGDKHENI